MQSVNIIGAGLAGSEAAYQLAKRGVKVRLFEMRPKKMTPAHHTHQFSELVCSNSLRSNTMNNAVGVMKEEMRMLDSLIIKTADQFKVPAGGALAVDREGFSAHITKTLKNHENITVIEEEVKSIPEGFTIVASGPLTSEPLFASILQKTGDDSLYFYDAAAPIIDAESINMDICYKKSRYDEENEGDYINCPMNKEEYLAFYNALIEAECAEVKAFELKVFEGCMPFEEMAKRGEDTLRYGPMKPVGLGRTKEERHYAVVQLRQDDARASLYNIVGFQTHLKFPEQKRIIQMIPGLEQARIMRYGVMHKNAFLNAPKHLDATYQFKAQEGLYFAGQITGVEGYVESAASGIVASLNLYAKMNNETPYIFPKDTIIGSQADYIAHANPKYFQPMNANFGLLPALEFKHKKKERKGLYAQRALDSMREYLDHR